MSAVIGNLPYSFLTNPMAGMRILLREASGGLKFLGGTREPKFTLKLDTVQLYDAASGAEQLVRQASVPTEIDVAFKATEFLADNLARFFQTLAPVAVAAAATAAYAYETFTAGKTGERYGLRGLRQTVAQRGDLKVYNVTDSALLVLDTDYSIVVQYGVTFIELKVDTYDAHVLRVGEGSTANTSYHAADLAYSSISPMVSAVRTVSGVLQIVSKTGINAELVFEKAQLAGGGEFNLQTKAPSDMGFVLTILDNSGSDAVNPFGVLKNYGYDSAGAALI